MFNRSSKSLASSGAILRRNVVTGQWVAFSPNRQNRPNQFSSTVGEQEQAATTNTTPSATTMDGKTSDDHVADCPFCFGNDSLLTTPIAAGWGALTLWKNAAVVAAQQPTSTGGGGVETEAYPSSLEDLQGLLEGNRNIWRVVPNKYPVVAPFEGNNDCDGADVSNNDISAQAQADDPSKTLHFGRCPESELEIPARGYHEVVVESTRHNAQFNALSILSAFRLRGNDIAKSDDTIQHINYFKNCGKMAGASLVHPHSQLVGLTLAPAAVKQQIDYCAKYFNKFGKSAFETMLSTELATINNGTTTNDLAGERAPSRVILATSNFVALVPYAATSPFNVWIVPRFDAPWFEDLTTPQHHELADVLQTVMGALQKELKPSSSSTTFDYNMVVHSCPLPDRGMLLTLNPKRLYRFYIEITPRLGSGAMAGFEFGTGMFSNGNLPEDDAAVLRRAL